MSESTPWRPRTMADALLDMEAWADDLGPMVAPATFVALAGNDEGPLAEPWNPEPEPIYCARCCRERLAMELVDVSMIPEAPHDYLCGGCLGDLDRAGILLRSAAAQYLGAPAPMVAALIAAETAAAYALQEQMHDPD